MKKIKKEIYQIAWAEILKALPKLSDNKDIAIYPARLKRLCNRISNKSVMVILEKETLCTQ